MEIGNRQDQQLISYLALRKLIGLAGVSLPIVLPIVCLLFGEAVFQFSISDYYGTHSRNILVGVLFGLAFFLLSYKGYEPIDSILANFGCVFALGVALFPCTHPMQLVKVIHFVSAGLLFSVFSWFSLVLFTRQGPAPTKQKKERNIVYIVCGWLIVASIVCIGLACTDWIFNSDQRTKYHIVYWLESLALFSFGYSWLVKGEFMFKDK